MILGAGAVLPGAFATASVAGAKVAPDQVRLNGQVRSVTERYGAAWNAADMDAMGALYTKDIHWVNVVGMHWQGFEEVDYAHRSLFETTFKGVPQALEEIESVTPLPDGGAVAVIRWAVAPYTSPSGQPFPASRTRMTLVLVPEGDELRIAHGANIQIVEPAQRSDPVVQRRQRSAS